MNEVTIISDGSINKNPGGLAKWCCIIRYSNKEMVIRGTEDDSTSNRAELLGLYHCLPLLIQRGIRTIKLISDSKYVGSVVRNGKYWENKPKKNRHRPNRDLWSPITKDIQNNNITIQFQWVKGHNGNIDNERADVLASSYDLKTTTAQVSTV